MMSRQSGSSGQASRGVWQRRAPARKGPPFGNPRGRRVFGVALGEEGARREGLGQRGWGEACRLGLVRAESVSARMSRRSPVLRDSPRNRPPRPRADTTARAEQTHRGPHADPTARAQQTPSPAPAAPTTHPRQGAERPRSGSPAPPATERSDPAQRPARRAPPGGAAPTTRIAALPLRARRAAGPGRRRCCRGALRTRCSRAGSSCRPP